MHPFKQKRKVEYCLCDVYQGFISKETLVASFVPLVQKEHSVCFESFLKPHLEDFLRVMHRKDGVFIIDVRAKNKPSILMEVDLNRGRVTQIRAML
ncbi:hypothetical protein [Helicobacter sp. 12S02232-10]|uniref:hypothetical protein n=1 Tax=Helicobacter sp. 12S02232-10 TaxID=1476197 RepID=UPI00117A979D|nr:hypothetical protein [Helicobacter sp. 12S02232-10]